MADIKPVETKQLGLLRNWLDDIALNAKVFRLISTQTLAEEASRALKELEERRERD